MAAIEELIKNIADPALREHLSDEVAKLKAGKKFGLVFEEHLPELVRLPSLPVRRGVRVAVKADESNTLFRVVEEISSRRVRIEPDSGGETQVIAKKELVVVKTFGEPMYPALVPVDSIERAPEKPWHTVINADNYHALQLLLYGYEGRVDVIYIDPPYNSGARDWKYNNNYVDGSDRWKHSKWLSFMGRRLTLAKRLLHPTQGVLVVTIDEHEVHHLGMLLEHLFPDHYRQMVTIVINPKGVTQGRFSRVEEYAICCFGRDAFVSGLGDDLLTPEPDEETEIFPRWKGLLRSGTNARREDRKNMFYPVLIDPKRGAVVGTGDPLPFEKKPKIGQKIKGFEAAWPIRRDGSLGNWGVGHKTLRRLIEQSYVAVGGFDKKRETWGLSYLSAKLRAQIASGVIEIVREDKTKNVVEIKYADVASRQIKAVWHRTSHDAGAYGSDLLSNVIGRSRAFAFPKSLYAVRDMIAALTRDRPNAVVLDFFAGSGTTLHATSLLNSEDGGTRRCILVTNNEVGEEGEKRLRERGFEPGSPEWEAEGICESVTWPRVQSALLGKREDGSEIDSAYLDGAKMSEGFAENAAYFRLDFLDPAQVARGDRFEAIAPILWMLAGCQGECALARGASKWFMPKGNPFAVLIKEDCFAEFERKLLERSDVSYVFLVTDSAEAFTDMASALDAEYQCIQLYRSYLDTFKINLARPGRIREAGHAS